MYVENRATKAERVKHVSKGEHSECMSNESILFILLLWYSERMSFTLRAPVRALHGDFQASGWVDISRSIANFSAFLLILTFTIYLKKIFDLLNVRLCSNYQRNRGNISPPQGGLKTNEIEHHKDILWFSGNDFAIGRPLDEETLVITLKAINQFKLQGSELRPSFCGFIWGWAAFYS